MSREATFREYIAQTLEPQAFKTGRQLLESGYFNNRWIRMSALDAMEIQRAFDKADEIMAVIHDLRATEAQMRAGCLALHEADESGASIWATCNLVYDAMRKGL